MIMGIEVEVNFIIQHRPHTRHPWIMIIDHPNEAIIYQEYKALGYDTEENQGKYRIVKVITLTEEMLVP